MLIASWPASGFKQHETSWRLFKPELWSGLQLASFPVTETRLAGLCHALYILEARLELKLPHNTASNQRILKSWVLIICIHTDVIQCVDNVTKSKINVHTKNQEWHTKKIGQPIYLSLILNPDLFNQSLWHCPFLSSACAAIPYPLPAIWSNVIMHVPTWNWLSSNFMARQPLQGEKSICTLCYTWSCT